MPEALKVHCKSIYRFDWPMEFVVINQSQTQRKTRGFIERSIKMSDSLTVTMRFVDEEDYDNDG